MTDPMITAANTLEASPKRGMNYQRYDFVLGFIIGIVVMLAICLSHVV